MLTSWKTSHGPQKSIITAPSEIRKATGILPWTGGLSGFAMTAGLSLSRAFVAPTASELAESSPTAENAIAATKPNRTTLLSNSPSVFIRSFMRQFLGAAVGSNDNCHHISASASRHRQSVFSHYPLISAGRLECSE